MPWDELSTLAAGLLAAYPPLSLGFHRVLLDDPSVSLQLLFGDAATTLGQLDAKVDVWFLDGFAPDRNPAMWSEPVLDHVARLSKNGAALATYTAAGHVRRNLQARGFEVSKKPGFGTKRDMTVATYQAKGQTAPISQPWFQRAPHPPSSATRVAVLGGGIAGAAAAHTLARRGLEVTLIEQGPSLGSGASGNPMAVVMPRVTADTSLAGRVMAESYRFALQSYETLADQGIPVTRDRRGALMLAQDGKEQERLSSAADNGLWPLGLAQMVTANEASVLAGTPLSHGGLFFPNAGWVATRDVLQALTADCQVECGQAVERLDHRGGLWILEDAAGQKITEADMVIAAAANALKGLDPFHWLPLEPKRGQVTQAPQTSQSNALSIVLAGKGYITPSHNGSHCLGATYTHIEPGAWDRTPGITDSDHRTNLDMVSQLGGALGFSSEPENVTGRAALRATTPDRLPIAGPLPARDAYIAAYQGLGQGRHWADYEAAPYVPGLYVLTGLGARGFVTAFLAAEIIAAQICGEPLPIESDLIAALHPGRFLIRDIKRLKV